MLLEKMMSRINPYSYPINPKAKKKEKKKPNFVFISTAIIKHTDPLTHVESLKQIGFTFRKKEQ